jgi:hypothetical protein
MPATINETPDSATSRQKQSKEEHMMEDVLLC